MTSRGEFLIMEKMTKEEIIAFVKSQGADICGIADLSDTNDYMKKLYGEYFSSFPRAVSFAIFYPKEVLQRHIDTPTRDYLNTVNAINSEINRIVLKAANVLERAGFRAFPIPASDNRPSVSTKGLHQKLAAAEDVSALPKIKQEIIGDFSHKLAAAKAGLGWVGKSCCIVNPQVGPRLRFGTILTDAPFEPDSEIPSKCGGCTKCRDICPSGAIQGQAFNRDDELLKRFDAQKCSNYLTNLAGVFAPNSCGLCVAVCPWGK